MQHLKNELYEKIVFKPGLMPLVKKYPIVNAHLMANAGQSNSNYVEEIIYYSIYNVLLIRSRIEAKK
jgi:hypothetical protein